jgi:hypothetical protein
VAREIVTGLIIAALGLVGGVIGAALLHVLFG